MNVEDDEQLIYRLALHVLPGIGPVSARNLVSYCGGVKEIFTKRKSELEKIPGIGPERAKEIVRYKNFSRLHSEVNMIKKNKINCLFYLDPDYPTRLKNCDDSPIILFHKGCANLNSQRIISIVGTRHITTYGKEAIDRLVRELQTYQPLIVSGLAYGVDIHAHKAALKNELPTLGVIASGIDKIYPAENAHTAEKMFANGGLLTEYIHGTKPERENFPARNRIVAGLSDAVIVIESASRGGALITADIANSYNRDVFALPGRITDTFSKGCHHLIRTNKAMIFESAADIIDAMNWDEPANKSKTNQLLLFNDLSSDEKLLIEVLKKAEYSSIDQLSIDTLMPVNKASSILLKLEFDGLVKTLPGKIYKINNG